MTQEQTQSDMFPLDHEDHDEFKLNFAVAMNGILGSIPFGVTVDPTALANAGKSVALAMMAVNREVCGE